jgi:hypothetical protein
MALQIVVVQLIDRFINLFACNASYTSLDRLIIMCHCFVANRETMLFCRSASVTIGANAIPSFVPPFGFDKNGMGNASYPFKPFAQRHLVR